MEFIVIGIIIVILIYVITKRNQFNKLRRAVKEEGANIGIQISKRTACLNDALNIAKLSHSHEVDGIERLTAKDQLNQLSYLGQKYPTLNAVSGYGTILNKALVLNEDIAACRELLNSNIRIYNDTISTFPDLIVAAILGYKQEKFVDEDNIEENKQLDKSDIDFSKF